MGNSRSQPCRRNKPLYLLYLIHRTWSMVADHRKSQSHCDDIDRETELSSRCSGCNDCAYRQDSLGFDSHETRQTFHVKVHSLWLLLCHPPRHAPSPEKLSPLVSSSKKYRGKIIGQ
uniref:Uncharacterized protein n=1 Tax=Vespula pensylvanica TaxID=30213 RepID=A0A834NZH0_VESPE|nr:hypothetical protein H0235_009841 [Vespula pensylvanica]